MAVAHDSRTVAGQPAGTMAPPPLAFAAPSQTHVGDHAARHRLELVLMVMATVVVVAAVCFGLGYLVGVTLLGG